MNHRVFSRALIRAFVIALPLSILAVNGLMRSLQRRFAAAGPVAGCDWSKDAPASVDSRTASASEAKIRRQFWASFYGARVCGRDGLALKSVALDELFPGYEDVLPTDTTGEDIWGRYFSRVFNLETWYPLDVGARPLHAGVSVSWQGNGDLFSTYGADVVFVGSSQIYRSIIPSAVSRALRRQGGPAPRALVLSTSGMLSENARFMAAQLARSGKKTRVAVFGYTPVMANLAHPNRASMAKAVKGAWRISDFRTRFELKERLPVPGWKAIFPIAVQSLEAETGALRMPLVRSTAASDLAAAAERFARTPDNPYFKDYQGAGPGQCDGDSRVESDLRATVASLLTIADAVIVFVPPATPIIQTAYPCLDEAVRKAVRSVASGNVRVVADDWKAYDLDYSDFLYETGASGVFVIDPIHTNYAGARKVTKRLAEIIGSFSGKNE